MLETPWALQESKLQALLGVLAVRATGRHVSPAEIQAAVGGGDRGAEYRTVDGVAVIPVYGVIAKRMGLMEAMSGGTSVDTLARQVRTATRDPDVNALLLDIHSPGGSVYGVPEVAQAVMAARERKPVVAVANSFAASAAYWIAAASSDLVVTPSGEVGSIGVYAAHEYWGRALEMEGVDVTIVTAGKYKAELDPAVPLSDSAQAYLQARVDEVYRKFIAAVAQGRGVSGETVRSEFGEGRMVFAEDAVRRGMADRIATVEETLERLQSPQRRRALMRTEDGGAGTLALRQRQIALAARRVDIHHRA